MATKKTPQELIEEKLSEYLKNANSFTEGAKTQFSGEGYRGNTKEYYDATSASVASSKQQEAVIRGMLSSYSRYLPEGYADSVTKYLDDFGGYENQILAAAKQDYEYFSRFADENAYTQYKASEKNRADIDSMSLDELEKKLSDLEGANSVRNQMSSVQSYVNNAKSHGAKPEYYADQQAELDRYQAIIDEKYGGITDIAYTTPDGKNVTWQSLYDRKSFEEDLASQMAEAKADPDYFSVVAQANTDANKISAYRGAIGDTLLARSIISGGRNTEVLLAREMTQDEADLYSYYFGRYGEDYADSYFESLYTVLDRRQSETAKKNWQDIASEHPITSSIVSIGGTLASGVEYLQDLAMQIATGKEQYNTSSAVTSAIRGTVAEEIDWTIGNWDAGAFVYNTFMSGVDSLASGLSLGAGGGIALGLSAAASAANDALDRGLSNKQAFWNGLASGVFECLFETVSIGQFNSMKEAVVHSGKDFAKNLGKAMGTNLTEELATEVANVLYDNLVNLDYSKYETDKRMYVALGMSEEEAHRKASEQLIAQIGEAVVSGALMGIGFGAVGSSISGVRSMMSDIDSGSVIAQNDMIAPLVELAKETTSPSSKAYKIANKVTDKTSARRIGALMREVGYALTEQNITDITNSLVERGMDAREAKKTATALADIAGAESVDTAIEQAKKNGVVIDDTVEAVIRDVVLNPESAVGSRSAKLADYGTRLTESVVRSSGMQGISEEDAVNLKKEAEYYGIGADEFLASAQASNATPAHFSRAFKERYLQGKIGDKTVSKYVNSYLSETEQNTAYRLGEIAAKAERESAQKSEAATPKKKVESGPGRVTVDDSVSAASREGAKTQIQAVEKIAEALGIRVRFYESVVSENGNRVLSTNQDTNAPNGWFDKDTNTVHLDIKAGKDGKGFVMFTLAHELTHFIAKWSKTQFNVLADFVTERYNKEGKDITRTIRNRMMNLAEQKIKSYMSLTTEEARYEYAREEVIADSMETMLASGNVMRDLADLRTQSEGLFNKIRGFLKQFADKIRKLYQKIAPETTEGKFIAESKDAVEELEKLFANALKVSAENYAASGNVVDRFVEKYESSPTPSDSAVMSGRQNYNGIREAFAKKELDALSIRLGDKFPLSRNFDSTMLQDNTPLVLETIAQNTTPKPKDKSYYVVGRKAFQNAFSGNKITVYIDRLGLDATLHQNIATESLDKVNSNRTKQTLIDIIPSIDKILNNSVCMAIERVAHTDNKSASLLAYRLYNLYWYAKGKQKNLHCLVCTIVQNMENAEGYVFKDIENVTINNGLSGNNSGTPVRVDNDKYTVSQLYRFVKTLPRKKGGINYTPDERYNYSFNYTKRDDDVAYSLRNRTSYAPTFYSHMGKVVDGIKGEKIGASGVVSYLKGKGVKDEEIKWSGIEAFLEGKKSVTKAELQEFVAGSMLQIEEQMSGKDIDLRYDGSKGAYNLYDEKDNIIDTFTYNEFLDGYVADSDEEIYANELDLREALKEEYGKADAPRWADYRLKGGTNYRELVFKLPNSSYSNNAMRVHWGRDAKGVLAHARLQDMTTSDGKKMLFIEEIQSDWHNEGRGQTYEKESVLDNLYDKRRSLYAKSRELEAEISKLVDKYNTLSRAAKTEQEEKDVYARFEKETRPKQGELISTENEIKDITERLNNAIPEAPFRNTYHEYVLKRLIRLAAEQGYDSIGWTTADIQSRRWSDQYAEGYRIEYDQDIPKFLRKYGKKWGAEVGKTVVGNNVSVWSMDITDSMQDSVLYEGQAMYQPRATREYTDRELLAGALDSVATSEEDRKKLTQYKKKAAEADELDRTLAELRAKKKALEEAKAKRSEIRAVQDEITKTQNRITIIDKQLFNLQATVSMKRVLESEKNRRAKQARANQKELDEKKRERDKQKAKELLDEQRDKYEKKIEEDKQKRKERWAEMKLKKENTQLRQRIVTLTEKLDRLLRNPTKEKHIPINLMKPVAEFLSVIDRDTFAADPQVKANLAKIDALIEKADNATDSDEYDRIVGEIDKIKNTISRAKAIGDSIQRSMAYLRAEYDAIAKNKDERIRNGYDPYIAEMISSVYENCGSTPLRLMTNEQLNLLYDMLKVVSERVSNANKAFKAGKQATIDTLAQDVHFELSTKKNSNSVKKFFKGLQSAAWSILKPATAFEIIGSDTLQRLYENLANGELTWMENRAKAKTFVQEKIEKYAYFDWDMKEVHTFTDTSGRKFTLTLGEMMSVYAYSKRPQSRHHLLHGGLKLDKSTNDRRNKKDRTADKKPHALSELGISQIISELSKTKGLIEFCDEMQAYLSNEMADLGNEITEKMYNIIGFTEDNYFPIRISQEDKAFNPDKVGEILLKNRSFTKATVKNASNAILVGDFTETWIRHVDEMITYNAFALELEDLKRVYNYNTVANEEGGKDAEGNKGASKGLIKTRISDIYGYGATEYIERLMQDVNGGVVASDSEKGGIVGLLDASVTRFKKLKVMASFSVTIQQPSAMARAFSLVDPKYFRGYAIKNHAERWERVKKYAPIASIKEMGRFDVNLGQSSMDYFFEREYSGIKDKTKAIFTDSAYRDEALTRAPAYADEMAWISIFEACEREMREKYANDPLLDDTERFMKAVGDRFTEVIRETQVYDSIFSRSQIMRNKGITAKMLTAFMSEPTTTLNMAFRSMLEASRSGKKWYALPFNRTMVAVSTSIILNSLLVSLVYAMRDDDEDETYLESYLESFTTEVADGFNPLTYIPFVKDIWSLLQGYDVERTDMALWSDIIDKAFDFIKVFNTDTSEMSEEAYDKWLKDVWSQSASAVSEILSFATGIPITNVIRDASGAVDTTVDALTSDRENSWDTMLDAIAEGFKNTLPGSNLKPNNPAKYDPTYSDYTSYKPKDAFTQFDRGNTAKGKEIIDKLIKARMEAGDTEKEAKASLRASFTSTYKDAYKKAYLAGDNAECVRIRKLLKDSGLFPNYIETYMSWQKEALKDKYKK